MAKKKKSIHRVPKVKKRARKKQPTHQSARPPSSIVWASEQARESSMRMFESMAAVSSKSCFDIDRPEVGHYRGKLCFGMDKILTESFEVLDCSERDILSGDFWVIGLDHEGKRQVLSARDWECERIMLGLA